MQTTRSDKERRIEAMVQMRKSDSLKGPFQEGTGSKEGGTYADWRDWLCGRLRRSSVDLY